MARDGNSLSSIIRDAFDHGDLRTLTKNSPAVATGAHISIIGHTTKDELLHYLGDTEAANGFANRFLWVCARRSKVLPYGGNISAEDFAPIVARLTQALHYARDVGEITHAPETQALWRAVYPNLSDGRPGLLGCVTNRAEALVLRLSAIYAVLDCTDIVSPEHLRAALAVWDYCMASARFVFGETLGDPVADELFRALEAAGEKGMTRTEARELFQRNQPSARIAAALGALSAVGKAACRMEPPSSGRGRNTERWFATRFTR